MLSDRVVVVSSSAAAVSLCTCILLMVFSVKWNSSRGWLSDTVSFPSRCRSGNENSVTAMFWNIHIGLLTVFGLIILHPINICCCGCSKKGDVNHNVSLQVWGLTSVTTDKMYQVYIRHDQAVTYLRHVNFYYNTLQGCI